MEMTRLREIIEAYGAEPARWPVGERAPAQALLRRSAEARAMQDDARRLDRALDLMPRIGPSPALAGRILAAAPASRGAWSLLRIVWPFEGPWRPVAAWASAAALGLMLGIFTPPAGLLAEDGTEVAYSQIDGWAFGEFAEPDTLE
jgi:hypothetical protein